MSDSKSEDNTEVASPEAYEALRARNIAIRKQKEHQIFKDSGLVELTTKKKQPLQQTERKDRSDRSTTFQSSSVCTRNRAAPIGDQTQDHSGVNHPGPFTAHGPPGYMMQNPNWGPWTQVPLDLNEARRFRRAAKRKYITEMAERKEQGLKPCKVVVDGRGYITDGKDEWYADLKSLCLNYLDLSVTHFSKQSSANVRLVMTDVDAKYEYVGGEISEDFLKGKILQIMKGERNRLKLQWETLGEGKDDAPCPDDVESRVWNNLIKYWSSEEGMARANQMADARAKVVHLNNTGRAGYHSTIHKMKEEKGNSPTLKEAGARIYTPKSSAGDHTKPPGSIPYRISSVKESLCEYRDDLQSLQDSVNTLGKMLQQLLELVRMEKTSATAAGAAEVAGDCRSPKPASDIRKSPKHQHAAKSGKTPKRVGKAPKKQLHLDTEDAEVLKENVVEEEVDVEDDVVVVNKAAPIHKSLLVVKPSCKRGIFAESAGCTVATETAKPVKTTLPHDSFEDQLLEPDETGLEEHSPTKPIAGQARAQRKKQFMIGDAVALKQPKNAKQEVAFGFVAALSMGTVSNLHTGESIAIPKGTIAITLVQVLEGTTLELPIKFEQYPGFNPDLLSELEPGDIVLWDVAHLKRNTKIRQYKN
ncbi:hypothetical protein R1sor_012643 [Riccia sorocarpa]|uniref:Uncharacterized protein n=1 Tax=Riccia sorocarpa TaxID=122646 RepID=A0ABD3I4C8_9MARC